MAQQRSSPMRKFQVVKGFGNAQVQIVSGSVVRRVNLQTATEKELEQLHAIGHPAVKEVKEPKRKSPTKDKE